MAVGKTNEFGRSGAISPVYQYYHPGIIPPLLGRWLNVDYLMGRVLNAPGGINPAISN